MPTHGWHQEVITKLHDDSNSSKTLTTSFEKKNQKKKPKEKKTKKKPKQFSTDALSKQIYLYMAIHTYVWQPISLIYNNLKKLRRKGFFDITEWRNNSLGAGHIPTLLAAHLIARRRWVAHRIWVEEYYCHQGGDN